MTSGAPRRFPTARQRAELDRFFSDPRIAAFLARSWTVDDRHDVPDLAGYSVVPGTLFVDRHLARLHPPINGKPYSVWLPALVATDYGKRVVGHEPAEKAVLDVWGYGYEGAHEDVATPCEHLVTRSIGLDWNRYSRALRPFIRRAELEDITDPPLDLDCRPYWQDPDANDLRVLRRLAELGVKDAQGHGGRNKLSHAAASYGPGHGDTVCGKCEHYGAPHCELVADPIEPGGWCRLWTAPR